MSGIPHGPGYLVNRNLKSLDSLIIYLRLDRGSDLEENLLGFCTKGQAKRAILKIFHVPQSDNIDASFVISVQKAYFRGLRDCQL
ncbi:hypothetical protein H634G_10856 [Metarhizium anisopliae BRIP 53293]|uniref:Uncharacterized protein n=1 Tax=Metarhizium anisopliae BRIP 53293 TaxID=1291518 RepID=A0A0D9NML2_METAN|nr:hypothetical protein H634G_10856 [Metarhizium anisopliae BRIP 53293]